LDSICKQIYKPNYIIIVDDSCDDETRDVVDEYSDIIYFHPIVPNSGLSAARNAGLEYVPNNTDIVLFLDDDVTLDKNYLKEMNKKFIRYPLADGMSGYLKDGYHTSPTWKKLIYAFVGFVLPPLVPVSINTCHVTRSGVPTMPLFLGTDGISAEWLSGCNMAYRHSIFKQGDMRFFDENLMGYAMGEDMLFSHKLYTKGKSLRMEGKALIEHRCSDENRSDDFNKFIMIFGYRRYIIDIINNNSLKFYLYYQWFEKTFIISTFILCIVGKRNWEHISDCLLAKTYVSKEFGISNINKFLRGGEE
jgi:glycosyltransferase involved in cell wall biosynthesis